MIRKKVILECMDDNGEILATFEDINGKIEFGVLRKLASHEELGSLHEFINYIVKDTVPTATAQDIAPQKESKKTKEDKKPKEETKPITAEEMLNRDPYEEHTRAQQELDTKRIHIRISELNAKAKSSGINYTDADYRKDLDAQFGVDSSKKLNHTQAEQFIKHLREMEDQMSTQSDASKDSPPAINHVDQARVRMLENKKKMDLN
jgi:ribosomal protein L12E/L44/L45/RPP1/RPP2